MCVKETKKIQKWKKKPHWNGFFNALKTNKPKKITN